MGAIGQAMARRLAGFEARLIYTDRQAPAPSHESALGLERRGFDEVLAASDFLVLAVPLTADTVHLIGEAAVARMKPGSYLINPARGSVVDEEAVAEALETGRLAGYAADVFEMEDWARPDRPATVSPRLLEDRRRTVLTPHIGSAVDRVRREIALEAADSLIEGLSGAVPRGAVNAEEVHRRRLATV